MLRTNQRRATWTVGGLVAAALVTALVLVGLAQRDSRGGAVDIAGPPATTVAAVATTVAITDGAVGPAGGRGHRASSAPQSSTPSPATDGSTLNSSVS